MNIAQESHRTFVFGSGRHKTFTMMNDRPSRPIDHPSATVAGGFSFADRVSLRLFTTSAAAAGTGVRIKKFIVSE